MRITHILAGSAAGLVLAAGSLATLDLATESADAQGGGAVTQAQFKALEARVTGLGQNSSAAQRISKNLNNVVGKYVVPEGTLIGARQPPGVIRQERGLGGGLPTEVIADGAITSAKLAPDVLAQASAAGATGPQGPAGPQGPPGLAGVEVVSGDPVSLPGSGHAASEGSANNGSIECPAGKVAIAGGVEQTNASGQAVLGTAGTNISLVRSSPSSPTRWTAGVENTGTTDRFFKVTVICATVAP